MRLLRTRSQLGRDELVLEEFFSNSIPEYAILSHTWSKDGEVLFSDVMNRTWSQRSGLRKIRGAIRQARQSGFEYIWIDTCCIDKTSSAELSEAINSMFKWYEQAEVCYAFLSDVDTDSLYADGEMERHPRMASVTNDVRQYDETELRTLLSGSRWWTRGWTLQELVAPARVEFFDSEWRLLGDRIYLGSLISEITNIDVKYLDGSELLHGASIAKRMSFASRRSTTREEDIAYCLLGIFRVHMPLLYGEGKAAFLRLQEEIIRRSDDQSIFAWRTTDDQSNSGLLAAHPAAFSDSGNIVALADWTPRQPYSMTNMGLRIDLRISQNDAIEGQSELLYTAALACSFSGTSNHWISIQMEAINGSSTLFTRAKTNLWSHQEPMRSPRTIFVPQIYEPAAHIMDGVWQAFDLGAITIDHSDIRETLATEISAISLEDREFHMFSDDLGHRGRIDKYTGFGKPIIAASADRSLVQSWFTLSREDEEGHVIILLGLLLDGHAKLGFTVIEQARPFLNYEARFITSHKRHGLAPMDTWMKSRKYQTVMFDEPGQTDHHIKVTANSVQKSHDSETFHLKVEHRAERGIRLTKHLQPV